MDIYSDSIQNLSVSDRLRLVEQIWDGLSVEQDPLPLPEWAVIEATRRRDEMIGDPSLGLSHEAVWQKIDDARNG